MLTQLHVQAPSVYSLFHQIGIVFPVVIKNSTLQIFSVLCHIKAFFKQIVTGFS